MRKCRLFLLLALALGPAAWGQSWFNQLPFSPISPTTTVLRGVVTADVNRDGAPDILTISNNTTVLVYTSTLNGTTPSYNQSILTPTNPPLALAVGDFNKDGYPDVAVGEFQGTGSVEIFLNDGTGNFNLSNGYQIGVAPNAVAVADVNGDGNLDLIMAGPLAVNVLRGKGDGTFNASPSNYTHSQTGTISMGVGDLNADGFPDLVVGGTGAKSVQLLVSQANAGGFGGYTVSTYPASGNLANFPLGIAIADFSNDGKLDLAIAEGAGASGIVETHLGNGTGGFSSSGNFALGTLPGGIVAADFNGDGRMDVAVTEAGSALAPGTVVDVLSGNGSGGLAAVTGSPFTVGGSPSAVAVADFTFDRQPDLVVLNQTTITVLGSTVPAISATPALVNASAGQGSNPSGTITVSVLVGGNTAGAVSVASNQAWVSPSVSNISGFPGVGTFTLNFNAGNLAPGRYTAALTLSNANGSFFPSKVIVNLLVRGPAGTIVSSSNVPVANTDASVPVLRAGDFNGDGKLDILAFSPNNGYFLQGNGNGGFTVGPPIPLGLSSAAVGDVNGDGKLDFVFTAVGGAVGVYLGNGDGTFNVGTPVVLGRTINGVNVELADFDQDGILDLIVSETNGANGQVQVFTGDGRGNFYLRATASSGTAQPTSMAVADLNGDGFPDVVFTSNLSNSFVYFLNQAGISLSPATSVTTNAGPIPLAIADLNGDARPEIVVGTQTGAQVFSSFNGTYNSSTTLATTFINDWVAVADFDGDGQPDIAAGGRLTANFFLNQGTLNFSSKGTVSYGGGPTQGPFLALLPAEDFNGDGRVDLVVPLGNDGGPISVQVFTGAKSTTTSSLPPNPGSPITYGTQDTLTLTVSTASSPLFATPTGTATFLDGNTPLGTANQTTSPFTFATTLGGGSHNLTGGYGGDTRSGSSNSSPVTFVVNPANQTINFGALNNRTFGSGSFTVQAGATSNLGVSFSSNTANTCSVAGSTVNLLNAGTCTIVANQGGNANYNAAAAVQQSFQITGQAQTINFPALPNRAIGSGTFALSATASSGLPVTLTSLSPSICSASNSSGGVLAIGICYIQATQAGNANFLPAPAMTQGFSVLGPTITVSGSGGTGILGQSFSASFSAGGGSGFYSYAASGLPSGLSMNASTGLISGIPSAAGTFPISVTATDTTYNVTGSTTGTITIAGITTSSPLARATVGTLYSVNFQSAGMGSPTWSASGLPPGLTMSSSGQLSGTPTGTAGSYSLSVTAVGNGLTVTANFALQVLVPPRFVTSSLPAGVVRLPYSASIGATDGVPPYRFSLPFGVYPPVGLTMDGSGNITGTPLLQGTTGFNVTVTDSLGATAQQSFAITIAPPGPLLNVSASALSFGTNVTTQGVSVTSAVAGSSVGFSATIGSGLGAPNTDRSAIAPQGLFSVSGGGSTPAVVTVSLNTSLFATLASGTYTATLVLTPSVQGAPAAQILLSAAQTALPAQLSAQPAVLSFRANAATPGAQSGSISVSNTGGGSFTFSASGGGGFITGVSASGGNVTSSSPGQVTVSIDSTGYVAGEYFGTINVSSSAGSQAVAVTLDVQPATAVLALSQTGVRFLEADNAAASPVQTVGVYNVGASGSTLNFTVAMVSGSEWLTLSASGSSATRQSPASLSLSPLNGLARSATPRYALIKVTDTASPGSAQFIQAVLDPSTPPAFPDPTPSGLVFVAAAGSTAPAQGAKLNTNGSSSYSYSTSAATSSGGAWLSVSPAGGTTSAGQPGVISAIASAANLTPGIYTGTIQVAISGSVRSVYVTFIVTPATGSSPERELSTSRDATCVPTKLAVTPAGIAGNFNVPAAWPASLIVRMYNDCGATVTNGRVVVNFSNGDPPISLLSDNLTGTYTGTWNVGAVSPAMTVTATGSLAGVASATATITGAVTTNSTPPPSIAANGIVHNSYPRLGGSLAPGNVAAIYGVGLANQTVSPGVVPLSTNFNGTDVVIGGLDAPLYFLSPGQLNVQIPFELAPNKSYQAVAIVNNAVTAPQTIALIPASPGVSAYSDGSLIAQHSDYSLVTAASPAKPGETLIMYLAGMGATTATVASGAPSPAAQVTAPVGVTVDGQSAAVAYAGFTPGGIGLYQINFTIPGSAHTGSLPVVVTEGGVAANTTTVPVKGN